MPAFMWASGFLYAIAYREEPYLRHVERKIKRLILPYVVVSLLLIGIKYAMQNVMYVENPVDMSDLWRMFYMPSAGYFLWFLISLFTISLIVPFFNAPSLRIAALIGSVILAYIFTFLKASNIFCIEQTIRFLPYFLFGCCSADYIIDIKNKIHLPNGAIIFVSVFLFSVITGLYFTNMTTNATVGMLCGFLGVGGIILLSEYLKRKKIMVTGLLFIGNASFVIYLFHTTIQGWFKAIFNKMNVDMNIGITLIVIILSVIMSIFLYYYIFSRYIITRKLFGIPSKRPNKSTKSVVLN